MLGRVWSWLVTAGLVKQKNFIECYAPVCENLLVTFIICFVVSIMSGYERYRPQRDTIEDYVLLNAPRSAKEKPVCQTLCSLLVIAFAIAALGMCIFDYSLVLLFLWLVQLYLYM